MYRIDIRINDDTIRAEVIETLEAYTNYGEIVFPADSDARSEFVEHVTDLIIENYLYRAEYIPDYDMEIMSLASEYGYTT